MFLRLVAACLLTLTATPPALGQTPTAETRDGKGSGLKPAFAAQTRAPNLKAGVAFDVTDVVKGLDNPFGFAFLPDGRVLITEREGRLRVAGADGRLSAPLAGVPKVAYQGQGGLLDVAVDPAFRTNGLIYASYAEPAEGGANATAVMRAKLVGAGIDGLRLENVQTLYRQRPALKSSLHFGSRLAFAKDGALFITQGERSIKAGRMQARDLKSGLGKVVRINTDGTIPKDNPFVGRADARPEIWSSGHRNVQGAFVHPVTGELWTMEHGPQGGDELNITRKGKDYGWPTISYGVEYGPLRTKIGAGGQKAGLEQPVYYWDPVIAPGAATFYNGDLFPAWKGSVFVSGLASGYVARLTMDGDTVKGEERLQFSPRRERYRDIEAGPDGALYLLTDGPQARLVKATPKR